jgi:hypothetical protein
VGAKAEGSYPDQSDQQCGRQSHGRYGQQMRHVRHARHAHIAEPQRAVEQVEHRRGKKRQAHRLVAVVAPFVEGAVDRVVVVDVDRRRPLLDQGEREIEAAQLVRARLGDEPPVDGQQ